MAATESITVLFTDLVSSTELSAALSAEAAHTLAQSHFTVLRRAVALSGGREVKNLGDGLMVVFPSVSAAVSCAVTMQQAVEFGNRSAPRPLGLRVGLSTGEAVREGDDFFGEPVVEAARLCARAEGGQVLAADLVRAMAGRRAADRFTTLGPLALKGLPEPVDTVEIRWEPLGDDAALLFTIPLPSRLATLPSMEVVGRHAERAGLAGSFTKVAAGEGRQVVLVSGEAGIGKTMLATEAARTAFNAGAVVLLGRCDEDLGAPYGPFVEALSHVVANAPEHMLTAHLRAHGAALARIVPALGQRLGRLPAPETTDPETERYLLFGAVVGLLAAVSETQPLVLVLDDLQWADRPSLQLLRHLGANTTSLRLLVIGTYRDSEAAAAHPLNEVLAALRREPEVTHIRLHGLDHDGVLIFIETAAGRPLDDRGVDLARAVYRETDGNPFFVGEVLRSLAETGVIVRDEGGGWSTAGDLGSIALPDSVREVIGSRVARLGRTAERVLPLGSVIGREFRLDLLARVSGCSEDELLDLLDVAAAAALVREVGDSPGRFSFTHALVQHTLYQGLGPTRRARAHRQVAEAIESLAGDRDDLVGELAFHWAHAPAPDNARKATEYARRAGEAALASLAPDDAVRHFTQALDFLGGRDDAESLLEVDLLLELGTAQRQAGMAEFRETFLGAAARARALDDGDRLVRAALGNSRGMYSASGAVDTDRVEVLQTALGIRGEGDSAERALLLATLCSELSFGASLDRRVALAEDARAMARRLGHPPTVIRVSTLVHDPLSVPSTLEGRLADTTEALALAERLGDPDLLFFAAVQCREDAGQAGDFSLAARCLAVMGDVSQRLRQPMLLWGTAICEVGQALLAGDPEEAEAAAERAHKLGTDSGQPDASFLHGAQVMITRLQQGRLDELVPEIEGAVAESPGLPILRALLAPAYLAAGEPARAGDLLAEAAADDFASLTPDSLWLMGITPYARAAIQLGAVGPAEQLCDLLEPHHAQVPYQAAASFEPVAFFLGGLSSVAGRLQQAEAYFTEAAALCARGSMTFATASTQLEWGRMLARGDGHGDHDRARRLLGDARSAAARHGYADIGRRAALELAGLP